MTNEELYRQYLSGDAEAFERLYYIKGADFLQQCIYNIGCAFFRIHCP